MSESRNRFEESQQEFWVEARRLPQAIPSTFYRKLDDTLNETSPKVFAKSAAPLMPMPNGEDVPASIRPSTSRCS